MDSEMETKIKAIEEEIARTRKTPKIPRGFITVKEAADKVGFTPSGITACAQKGELFYIKTGCHMYIKEADVKLFWQKRAIKSVRYHIAELEDIKRFRDFEDVNAVLSILRDRFLKWENSATKGCDGHGKE